MDVKAIDLYLQKLKKDGSGELNDTPIIDDSDIAEYLEDVKRDDENKFYIYLNSLPMDIRAQTFIELPTAFQIDLILTYDAKGLADIIEALESDDATDLFLAISKVSKTKEEEVFALLDDKKQRTIEKLIQYDKDKAGSLMQTEIFKVSDTRSVAYAIEKLSWLKKNGIGKVSSLFITDAVGKLLQVISMDDLILLNPNDVFTQVISNKEAPYSIASHDSVDEVISMIEKYDLTSLAVVDRTGHLIGRITHDDVLDIMQTKATQQIYNLNHLDADEELHGSFAKTGKTRAVWLSINLINAIAASLVIGLFEDTLHQIVALAVLMPIVANMAGTASMQTVTVIVRQLALGEISYNDIKHILQKEIGIAVLNGFFLGVITAVISQIRFENMLVSVSIGASMMISFLFAGLLGTSIPLLLKKLSIDPAVASSVLVLTMTDIIAFFSFLWLAEMIIL